MDFLKSVRVSAESLLEGVHYNKTAPAATTRVWIIGGTDLGFLLKRMGQTVASWQLKNVDKDKSPVVVLASSDGPLWILRPACYDQNLTMEPSDFGAARDVVGQWYRQNKDQLKGDVQFEFFKTNDASVEGALVGLGLGAYRYLDIMRERKRTCRFFISRDKGVIDKDLIRRASALVSGMNVARHLSNSPGGDLNPVTMAKAAQEIFRGKKGVKVQVWDEARLKKEKMGLLLGVGQGAQHGARLIHISYRPGSTRAGRAVGKVGRTQARSRSQNQSRFDVQNQPIAFVGKGVTFDTGGLDIKPSSNMRLMKKDMSGSAIVLGLALYAAEAGVHVPCDFYLSMAENSVSDRAMRPGDVLRARNGMTIEIHNTDAEGRLVMADALDVAVTRAGVDAPREVIDVATLTGAMRVSVGLEVAGYFANDDKLAARLEKAAAVVGEAAWRMPLVQKYRKSLKSSFADMSNCGESSFGGAINAALFLESFIRNKPWAHFDVMAWSPSADGPYTDGGNAQALQTLARYLDGQS